MRAIIYARVSTDRQEEQGTSLESQVEACREFALERGLSVERVVTESHSAGVLHERPLLSEAREQIKQGLYDSIICFSVDRLSRNISHLLILIDEFQRFNTELFFVKEQLDDTPEGKLMLSIQGYLAEVEREKIKERTGRGKRHKLLQGQFIPAGNLYGYTYDRETNRRVPIETEAATVRRIFDSYLSGLSIRGIVKLLNSEGLAPPSLGKRKFRDGRVAQWRESSIRRMLVEPSYYGKTFAHRFQRTYKYDKGRKITTISDRDQSEWIELFDVTPAIISKETYEAVQSRRLKNKGQDARNQKHFFLLRGLIFCSVCGCPMYAELEKGKTRIYRCSSRDRLGAPCGGKRVNAKVEDAIWGVLKTALSHPERIKRGMRQKKLPNIQPQIDRLTREIKTLAARAADAPDEVWAVMKQQIEAKTTERSELLQKLQLPPERDIWERVKDVIVGFENASDKHKRQIFEILNVRVVGSGKKVDVEADIF